VITTLAFTATGMPEPPGAPTSGPPASTTSPGPGNEPRVLANTTVGGRPPEFTTPDAPGLSAATSKCDISTDAGYAFTPGAPIKVGGGPAQGPARERQYLSALRGPAGQGLAMIRRGSLLSPDGQTILDLYEITYAGLATPLRLYLDEYHEEPLKAPRGLACAVPVVVK